jgi:hypothetical protein
VLNGIPIASAALCRPAPWPHRPAIPKLF